MTNKEAAQRLGCSVTTARDWACGWCGQTMLYVAQGRCGAIYEKCDTDKRVDRFIASHPISRRDPNV